MPKEKSKQFTLLIYTDASSKVRRLNISFNVLRFVFVFAVILIAGTTIMISNLFLTKQKLDDKIVEIQRVEYKINYREVELANLEKKTAEIEAKTKILENYLKEVEELDKMVRSITGQGGFEDDIIAQASELNAVFDIENDPNELYYYLEEPEAVLEDIESLINDLLAKAPEISEKLAQDKQDMEDYIYIMEHTPSIWPTWGRLTTRFNNGQMGRRGRIHYGLDIANSTGTPISTTASGVVIFVGWHGGYGNKIVIYHGNEYSTVYAHLSRMDVYVGQEVVQGDVIGRMGNTGRSTGPHLHYEVYVNGTPKDPMDFLP
jgi:murein DD-endopeptidase MepM/ murein hydrolase activator NlpD